MAASPNSPWRNPPKRVAVRRLLQDLYPGAALDRVSRLRGGLASGVFSVSYRRDGKTGHCVVRLPTAHRLGARENARREYLTMQRVYQAGVPSPQPLLLDLEGEYFGMPAIVMSFEGRSALAPRYVDRWLRDLAGAMLALHKLTLRNCDLSHLDVRRKPDLIRKLDEGLPDGLRDDALGQAMLGALRSSVAALDPSEPCLVHDDYWPGNTVWLRGRLSAIIDWTPAKVGDRREDIAQCRIDLAMIHGPEVAERFLDAYQSLSPQRVRDVWFFDLLRGIDALDSFRTWLPGYHDIGLRELSEETMETRLRAFLEAAVAAAE